MTQKELIDELNAQKELMIAVATGGPKIQEVNQQYIERRERILIELRRLNIDDTNPYGDLWAWYGKWSSGNMATWASRRVHVAEIHNALLDKVRSVSNSHSSQVFNEPTGWPRVDRTVDEVRRQIKSAASEEQFQSIGLLCRELLINVSQVVYDKDIHRLYRR